MLKKVLLGFVVVSLLFLVCTIALIALGSDTSETIPLTAGTKAMVVSGIKGYPAVLDAAVSQKGDSVNLVLIVVPGTSESEAERLGENAVRMTKTLSQDASPGNTIGKGMYNYLVSVYYPNERMVAQGAKVTSADRISW